MIDDDLNKNVQSSDEKLQLKHKQWEALQYLVMGMIRSAREWKISRDDGLLSEPTTALNHVNDT